MTAVFIRFEVKQIIIPLLCTATIFREYFTFEIFFLLRYFFSPDTNYNTENEYTLRL